MKQCALVIGNNGYPGAALKNGVNDARDIAAKLSELGFSCMVCEDATHKEMDSSLRSFAEQLCQHEVGLFFFAGHGMQIEGENYLAAVDTNFDREIDAKHSSLPLDKVIETMEKGGSRTSIIMLDACRNNPYERRWRGFPRGLAPVYAPKGMIIGYATSPGQLASDGTGANGAYTHALLSHIRQQDLTIENFFKRVRNTLSSCTNGKQISWEHTSLMGDYFFNRSNSTGTVAVYSEHALADGLFHPHGNIADIIAGLKACDWHQQNPAMASICRPRLEDATKDECFVLGRNIYQASCGGSFAAVNFMEGLASSLTCLSEAVRFHVLNGMLYEIYFDSRGLKRELAKSHRLDEVFTLESLPAFASSFEFINEALKPYASELFYMPGTRTEVCVDAVIEDVEMRPVLTRVCFEGQNVLYNSSGDGYFDPSLESAEQPETTETLHVKLGQKLATPTFRLKMSLAGSRSSEKNFFAPYCLKIKRIASR